MSLGNQEATRRFGHEIIATAILPLLLIQEEQLSVNGKRMCAKYWLPASGMMQAGVPRSILASGALSFASN